MSDSSHDLNSTWTLFCVGCNERFPYSGEDPVCPTCGFRAFNDTSSDDTQLIEDGDRLMLFIPESGQFNFAMISLTAVVR